MPCAACQRNRTTVTQTNCSAITVSDLEEYLTHFQCIKSEGNWLEVNMMEEYVDGRIVLLNTMIADKSANPSSCTYQNYVDGLSQEVTTIILNTDC